ncbi:MFS transporter [Quadrisphaera sp. DSM 44207]|uniref:MFS transporter n=1 Tax=Quadrisphaera sp. DSM 44207 TaxID=1881057 RepID=UPI000887938E|nr:MFS transporter [Quadrisphaera sp. DSM 44207]SDQ04131.1 drug resistance transporter, EmrB/QacA subfamily [Quadrisphaera sp. DSM 44207]
MTPPGSDPRRWRILTVCLASGFLSLLSVSIVNVALPAVQAGVGASAAQLQWVLTGYALTFGLALVPAGRLGDSYGRRRLFMTGLAVFLLASLACGLATSPGALIAARLAMGVGAGVLNPQVSAIIQNLFTGAERGRAFGLFGGTIGVSTAIGPLLGGAILALVPGGGAWRWVFWVNLPVGAVALLLAHRLLPREEGTRHERLDVVGSLLLGLAVLGVLLGLQEQAVLGLPLALAVLLAAAAAAGAFVAWERRYAASGRTPLARPALLRHPPFAAGVLVGSLYFAGFTAIFVVLTLYLQQGLGYTPLQAGLSTTPFAIAGAVTAPLAGRVVTRVGRRMVVAGLCLVAAGLLAGVLVVEVLAPAVGAGWTGALLALPLAVAGAGGGLVISPNVTLTLAEVPLEDAGSASGVLQTAQRLGSAAGIAGISAVFFAVSAGGRWQPAITVSLLVTAGLVALALVPAVLDARRRVRSPAVLTGPTSPVVAHPLGGEHWHH